MFEHALKKAAANRWRLAARLGITSGEAASVAAADALAQQQAAAVLTGGPQHKQQQKQSEQQESPPPEMQLGLRGGSGGSSKGTARQATAGRGRR